MLKDVKITVVYESRLQEVFCGEHAAYFVKSRMPLAVRPPLLDVLLRMRELPVKLGHIPTSETVKCAS